VKTEYWLGRAVRFRSLADLGLCANHVGTCNDTQSPYMAVLDTCSCFSSLVLEISCLWLDHINSTLSGCRLGTARLRQIPKGHG